MPNEAADAIILYLEAQWFTKGRVPDFDTVASDTESKKKDLIEILRSEYVRDALERRGVRNPFYSNHYFIHLPEAEELGLPPEAHVNVVTSKNEAKSLTELQFIAINVMLDFRDNRSQKKKLSDYGISTAQWDGWLQDPVFQDYLQGRAEALLGQNQHEAHLALIDRVRSGDLGAIKYFNSVTGRFTENSNDQFNPQFVIMRVIEIITMRVQDAELQQAIASDLMTLAAEVKGTGRAAIAS